MGGDPYADAAHLYLERGWLAPIPLGRPGERGVKSPVPKAYTGRGAVVPTEDEIESWCDTHGMNNIGLRVTEGYIGIDVDAYDDKHGDETLARLEAELGELPPTYRSTARGWSNPSGIRFYDVPEGLEFITKLKGIDIIQPHHRYAVVYPSVHPDLGTVYTFWNDATGRKVKLPRPDAFPELPEAWVDYLTKPAGKDHGRSELSRAETLAWLAQRGAGKPCRAVGGVLRKNWPR